MAKFYIQSGTLRAIVDSADASRAALWAVHQAMQQIAPIDDSSSTQTDNTFDKPLDSQVEDKIPSHAFQSQGFIALGDSILLSEVGFDHDDAMSIDTFEAFREWHSLWHALEKLEKLL